MDRQELEQTSEVTIQDLPEEILEKILNCLDLEDRVSALGVCKGWSALKLNWSSVQLTIDYRREGFNEAECRHILLASNRRYENLLFACDFDHEKHNLIKDILSHFSNSMRSLKLVGTVPIAIEIKFFAEISAHCSKLKYLHIKQCIFYYREDVIEFAPMNDLEELHVATYLQNPVSNVQRVMPNISKLYIQIGSTAGNIDFLELVRPQLLELKVKFMCEEHFLTVCSMHFPLLKKFDCFCDFLMLADWEYERMVPDYTFFQQMPELREVILRCHNDDGDIQRWCQCFSNIEVLCLRADSLSKETLRAICQLQHLKRLRIEEALVVDLPGLDCPTLTSLRMLSLYKMKIWDELAFSGFVLRTFPCLTVLEVLHQNAPVEHLYKLYANICKMPSVQRLVLEQKRKNMDLGRILRICGSRGRGAREIRLKFPNVLDTVSLKGSRLIPTQTLILIIPKISETAFENLILSMRKLRRLELNRLHYRSEVIQGLRAITPRCQITARREFEIQEPL